ncbi:hypothetical protein HaLaN_27442, partial [Haematococcus lacustris]
MDSLGLSGEASVLEHSLGAYWEPAEQELVLARHQAALQSIVATTTARFSSSSHGAPGADTRSGITARISLTSAGSVSSRRRRNSVIER